MIKGSVTAVNGRNSKYLAAKDLMLGEIVTAGDDVYLPDFDDLRLVTDRGVVDLETGTFQVTKDSTSPNYQRLAVGTKITLEVTE